jgi:hypothetical protein
MPYFDPETGEDAGERPASGLYFNEQETEAVTRFLVSIR